MNLLSATDETVGTAVTMFGALLHEFPVGYVEVTIRTIQPNIQTWPNLPSDEACLTAGSITAWPVKTSICNIISELLLYYRAIFVALYNRKYIIIVH